MVSSDYRAAINALKEVRTEAGISQRELARRLNKPPSFVNKIEQLERRLDVLEFIVIAQALEIEPKALLGSLMAVLPEKVSL
ncbi:MAG: helix-turn-helix transcriptional regulator [Sphingorhabdus sp.]